MHPKQSCNSPGECLLLDSPDLLVKLPSDSRLWYQHGDSSRYCNHEYFPPLLYALIGLYLIRKTAVSAKLRHFRGPLASPIYHIVLSSSRENHGNSMETHVRTTVSLYTMTILTCSLLNLSQEVLLV